MGEFVPKFERNLDLRTMGPRPLPTAGAVQVKNEKGEITMKKVKVQRYMAGKAPEFAKDSESESDAQSDVDLKDVKPVLSGRDTRESRTTTSGSTSRRHDDKRDDRRRHGREPEIVRKREDFQHSVSSSSSSEDEQALEERRSRARRRRKQYEHQEEAPLEYEDPDDEEDEEERLRRRMSIKRLAKQREEEELLAKQEDAEDVSGDSEEESSEEEEETESEEDAAPRLKPVFVRKRDRITLIEVEKEHERLEQIRLQEDRRKEERKKESVKLLEDTLRREQEMEKTKREENVDLTAVNTDDESEEIAYELWKVREMKRLKRNREERELQAREKTEVEKIHNMTEEERRNYLRMNPKVITNRQDKGKYKFLQKYYHRGVFFLDQEDDVLKRNFAEATGEDEFDKSVMPKVMQVKNFGKASRSKWTHLTAEDTTDHQGIWAAQTALNAKFSAKQAAGMRNVFEKPAMKKRKGNDD